MGPGPTQLDIELLRMRGIKDMPMGSKGKNNHSTITIGEYTKELKVILTDSLCDHEAAYRLMAMAARFAERHDINKTMQYWLNTYGEIVKNHKTNKNAKLVYAYVTDHGANPKPFARLMRMVQAGWFDKPLLK